MKKSEALAFSNDFMRKLTEGLSAYDELRALGEVRESDEANMSTGDALSQRFTQSMLDAREVLALAFTDECDEHDDCLQDEQLARTCARGARLEVRKRVSK